MKAVLVTGASGLVGSAIKNLESEYPEFKFVFVGRKEADLTKELEVEDLFVHTKPDYVLHCGARVGGIGRNLNSPVLQYKSNILMNTHVIDQAFQHGVEKLIAFSSVCVFPATAQVLKEDIMHNGPPFPAHWSYAMAKRMVDVQIGTYRDQYDLNYCSVIPTNIMGENDNYNLEDGHIVPSIINKFYNAILTQSNVECWGDGSPLREFIYSRDLAKVCLELLSKDYVMPQRLIVPGQEMTIKKIVEKIDLAFMQSYKQFNEIWPDIVWNKNKPNGQLRRKTESLYFDKIFPNFEHTNIDLALKNSVEWFIMNYANARK